jgi:hypothetical protein
MISGSAASTQCEMKLEIRNSKHLPARSRFGEGRRNPKQYKMTKIRMVQTKGGAAFLGFGHWNIGYLNLSRISNFEIRI